MSLRAWLSHQPDLTPSRIRMAYAIAVSADVAQFALGPLGWGFADEVIDVIAMALMSQTLGFHPFFLPTFVLEFVPLVDMLPTWTACTAIVISTRKKLRTMQPTAAAPAGLVIDVEAKRVE